MDDESGDRPRKKSRSKSSTGRQAKKKRSIPWYRHLSILITTGVCIVFAVLIAGTVVVRKVILTARPPVEDVTTSPNFEPTPTVQPVPAVTAEPIATKVEEPKEAVVTPVVQPVPAAEKPGAKLAKMLLVGTGKDTFPTISEAIKAATPGDIIEVRTNGPLLEPGAELKPKARIKGVPITIRKGDGFDPVIRLNSSLIQSKNVDLVVTGMHFVSNRAASVCSMEDGDLSMTDCTLYCLQNGPLRAVNHFGSAVSKEQFQISFERCFLRESTFGTLMRPRLAFHATNCGKIGMLGGSLIMCELGDQNLVSVNRCTFINSWVMSATVRDQRQWDAPPFTCRINQSILGHLLVPPRAVHMGNSPLFQPRNANEALVGVNKLFTLEGSDSVRQLVNAADSPILPESWIGIGGLYLGVPSAPNIPAMDRTMKFGEGLERVRQLTIQPGKYYEAQALIQTLLPDQLAVTSTGPLAELRDSGIEVGCDISQLPVPPPTTLEPFIVPN
ncbi:MAG TPA: hypothetical protein VGM98_24010 [Schlesneria sp.]